MKKKKKPDVGPAPKTTRVTKRAKRMMAVMRSQAVARHCRQQRPLWSGYCIAGEADETRRPPLFIGGQGSLALLACVRSVGRVYMGSVGRT